MFPGSANPSSITKECRTSHAAYFGVKLVIGSQETVAEGRRFAHGSPTWRDGGKGCASVIVSITLHPMLTVRVVFRIRDLVASAQRTGEANLCVGPYIGADKQSPWIFGGMI